MTLAAPIQIPSTFCTVASLANHADSIDSSQTPNYLKATAVADVWMVETNHSVLLHLGHGANASVRTTWLYLRRLTPPSSLILGGSGCFGRPWRFCTLVVIISMCGSSSLPVSAEDESIRVQGSCSAQMPREGARLEILADTCTFFVDALLIALP